MFESLLLQLATAISTWPAVFIFVAIGVAGLKYGADWLVNGASNFGFRMSMSPTLIGLTIVAFGTSAPELVVSLLTAAQGRPEICLGNVIGSNVANIALILGATAIISPLAINRNAIRLDGPLSLAAATLILILAVWGRVLSRVDGILLLTIFFVWLGLLIYSALRKKRAKSRASAAREPEVALEEVHFHQRPFMVDFMLILVGLIALIIGADTLVGGAVLAARTLSVPEIVVGLTLVAGGTSLPELAVCLVAASKNQGDITVGNVFGSNLFNALLILGSAVSIAPISFNAIPFGQTGFDRTLFYDLPFFVFVSALIIPMMAHKRSLSRFKGGLLIGLYVAYMVFLVVRQG